MEREIATIDNFKELLNEIMWSWDFPNYDLEKCEEGYALNKLFISRDEVTYKMETWKLAPGVYEELERFYEFLQTTK